MIEENDTAREGRMGWVGSSLRERTINAICMHIGLIFKGNEKSEIWGSAIITLYLAEALENLGHVTWRISVSGEMPPSPIPKLDLVISEGVPAHEIPEAIWEAGAPVVLWCLSNLSRTSWLERNRFDGVASNSQAVINELRQSGIRHRLIELAAAPSFAEATARVEYQTNCTYVGCYPHKRSSQMQLLLNPAARYGLDIWGYGWEASPFSHHHRGPLPLHDIAPLYKATKLALGLTEVRQMELGMINNRVFEALASGTVLLAEKFGALEEHELGCYVNMVETEEEATEFFERFFSEPSFADTKRRSALLGQAAVLNHHTYRERAQQFLCFGTDW